MCAEEVWSPGLPSSMSSATVDYTYYVYVYIILLCPVCSNGLLFNVCPIVSAVSSVCLLHCVCVLCVMIDDSPIIVVSNYDRLWRGDRTGWA